MSSTSTITATGACDDGIDHDQDQIWVVLGPEVDVTYVDRAGCTQCTEADGISWSFGPRGELQYLLVGELKGTLPWRPHFRELLDQYGIDAQDLKAMLAADPFANLGRDQPTVPDPRRFVRIQNTFPYVPADRRSSGSRGYSMAADISGSQTQEVSESYEVGLTVSASGSLGKMIEASLSSRSSWTWTNSNSATRTRGSSTAAAVTFGRPSDSYTGPLSVQLYYDTLYATFLFVPVAKLNEKSLAEVSANMSADGYTAAEICSIFGCQSSASDPVVIPVGGRGRVEPVATSGNLAANGSLDVGLEPWWSLTIHGTSMMNTPELLARETGDTWNGSTGAVRLTMPSGLEPYPTNVLWNSGAVCPLNTRVPAGTTMRVRFAAKSLSGASTLTLVRLWGGSNVAQFSLGSAWRRYEAFITLLNQPEQAAGGDGKHGLVFNLTDENAWQTPAPGAALIDDIEIVSIVRE